MALLVTPAAASSVAIAKVSPMIPALAAAYTGMPSNPKALCDVTLTMRPHPRSTMIGAAARHVLNVPVRCTPVTPAQSANGVSRMVPLRMMPATFTRMSTPPSSSTAVRTMSATASGR